MFLTIIARFGRKEKRKTFLQNAKKGVDKIRAPCYYIQALNEARKYGRVVELVDSLDSGSSVHCGRAGSSPASPTKEKHRNRKISVLFLVFVSVVKRTQLRANQRTCHCCYISESRFLDIYAIIKITAFLSIYIF